MRDSLMKRKINDIDIATSSLWQETARACKAAGMRVHETGVAHGTVTIACDEEAFEVTTFRSDSTTSADARHPDSVTFVSSIEEDLLRRDFTMNAIAWHPERGLLDPYGGANDILKGIIRTVGNPKQRFHEDALRILRACRFASQLGFQIDPPTFQGMLMQKHLLSRVSVERITHELDLFVMGPFAHDALMSTVDVLEYVLPELTAMKKCQQVTKYHIYDVLEHTAWAVQYAERTRLVRWAALCHDMGKPAAAFFDNSGNEHFYGHAHVSAKLARSIADRLLMSSSFKSDLCAIVSAHSDSLEPTSNNVKRALARLGGNPELYRSLLSLKRADILAHAPAYHNQIELIDQLEKLLGEIQESNDAFKVSQLAINGDDIMALGVRPGPKIGKLLRLALDAVIDGNAPNQKNALLSVVRESLSKPIGDDPVDAAHS